MTPSSSERSDDIYDADETFEAACIAAEDACPMGCGRTTEDPYGGPCEACWRAVDEQERSS